MLFYSEDNNFPDPTLLHNIITFKKDILFF